MSRKTAPILPDLIDILRGLGENIRLARLRRSISTTMLAERAGMTRTTLRSVERGEAGVTIGAYASVLSCLGLEGDIKLLAKDDELGRKLQDAGLTHKKTRVPRRRKTG